MGVVMAFQVKLVVRAGFLASLLAGGATTLVHAATADEELNALADEVVAQALADDPRVGYLSGLPVTDHSRFADRSPEARAAFEALQEANRATLQAIDQASLSTTGQATYAVLKEQLEAELQLRVCNRFDWDVNHFSGWQSDLAVIAGSQPVETEEERAQALKRWSTLLQFVDMEIANLRRGLERGYAAPKSVVNRVIEQMVGLAGMPPEKSPLYSPADRAKDTTFETSYRNVLAETVNPALARYGAFLKTEYLGKARDSVAIYELPNGPACYQAYLRYFTTLSRTPQEVFDLGSKTVAANTADVLALGKKLFGLDDFIAIVEASKGRAENKFKSKDELLAFSRELLVKAKEKTATLVSQMPQQDAVVEPQHDFEEQAGVSSHYEPNPDVTKPGIYRIQLGNWATQTRGQASITVVHESWPGHHLQIALARELIPDATIFKIAFNSAYIEGWARYAEMMAEEAGIYDGDDARITRRIWPARGMVVDPGLHALGWSRQQAVDYLVSTGRFTAKTADDMVDRIAVMPGQLTSYDSGGLEIKALRAEAMAALGEKFNLAAFNRTVLEMGVLPLSALRAHVEAWIAKTKSE
jgi:uncharacterized protein (DUF885 family)